MSTSSKAVDTNGYSSTARKVMILGGTDPTAVASDTNPVPVKTDGWDTNTNAKGSLGAELTITPSSGTKQAFEFIINAPAADLDAILLIKRDSTTIFNGFFLNRDTDGAIKFPAGDTAATTNWKVTVTGGEGDLFVLVRHN